MSSYPRKFQLKTADLVKAGLLAAISIVLTRFLSLMVPLGGLPALRVGFGPIPIILSGMLFGPVVGALTGVVADVIGFMINPTGGIFFPGFTFSAALNGIISGVLFHQLKIQNSKKNYNILNSIVIGIFLLAIVFNEAIALPFLIVALLVSIIFIAIPFIVSKNLEKRSDVIGYDKIAFTVTLDYIVVSLILNTLWLSMMFDKGFVIFLPGRIIASVIVIPIYTFVIYTLSKYTKLLK